MVVKNFINFQFCYNFNITVRNSHFNYYIFNLYKISESIALNESLESDKDRVGSKKKNFESI